jgi:hypothetical protein
MVAPAAEPSRCREFLPGGSSSELHALRRRPAPRRQMKVAANVLNLRWGFWLAEIKTGNRKSSKIELNVTK